MYVGGKAANSMKYTAIGAMLEKERERITLQITGKLSSVASDERRCVRMLRRVSNPRKYAGLSRNSVFCIKQRSLN